MSVVDDSPADVMDEGVRDDDIRNRGFVSLSGKIDYAGIGHIVHDANGESTTITVSEDAGEPANDGYEVPSEETGTVKSDIDARLSLSAGKGSSEGVQSGTVLGGEGQVE